MPIVSVRDNKNNTWERNAKKRKKENKDRKEQAPDRYFKYGE